MLANGSSLATVDNLPLDDAKQLFMTLHGGLWGPYGEANMAYSNYCSLHLNKEVAVAVASGKKYKPTPAMKFHEMFPNIDEYMTMGAGTERRVELKKVSIAKKAAATLTISGAPAWLIEAAK